jgi:hypothetical protein
MSKIYAYHLATIPRKFFLKQNWKKYHEKFGVVKVFFSFVDVEIQKRIYIFL